MTQHLPLRPIANATTRSVGPLMMLATVLACGSSPTQSEDVEPSPQEAMPIAVPSPETTRAGPGPELSSLKIASIFLLSKTLDEQPSSLRVTDPQGALLASCTFRLPGNEPLTHLPDQTECRSEDGTVAIAGRYPLEPLPPRPEGATHINELIPIPVRNSCADDVCTFATPPLPTSCDGDVCNVSAAESFETAPNAPHVRINLSSQKLENVQLAVTNTDRSASASLQLRSPSVAFSILYLDVDVLDSTQ